MKKWLTIFGTIALVGTTSINVISCGDGEKFDENYSAPVNYRAMYLDMSQENQPDEWLLAWVPYYYSFGNYKHNLTINENKYNQFKDLLVNLLGTSFTPDDKSEFHNGKMGKITFTYKNKRRSKTSKNEEIWYELDYLYDIQAVPTN